MKYKFTVFTPCYNSENIIERLFNSLQKQTFNHFEWIVLDDCSKDNTVSIIEKLIPQAKFPVKFIKNKENLMETKNIEIGLAESDGFLFVRLSHDDMLIPKALENYNSAWETLSEEEKHQFAGVICNCLDKNLVQEGQKFPKDLWKSNDFEMRYKYKIKGEKCSAQRVDILKKFPFYYPNIDTYVPASLHYFTVSFYYQQLYSNNFATIHVVNDGMHKHMEAIIKTERRYSAGIAFFYENMVNDLGHKVWNYSKFHYLLYLINFIRYSRYDKQTYFNIKRKIKNRKLLYYPAFVIANLVEIVKYKTIL